MTSETKLKKEIKEYLYALGWFYFHNLQRRYSYKGIPDITAIKKGVVIMIEVKTPGNKRGLTDDQKIFRMDWVAHGGLYVMPRSVEELHDFIGSLK